ncbi:MAG: hypothetical protein EOO88_28210 [Pedobacter sp.]|nr:MAG: hypothetical protein EOO88_28210 [Pedobacter sp.]
MKVYFKCLLVMLLSFTTLISSSCSKDKANVPKTEAPPPARPPGPDAEVKVWKQTEFILSSFFALPGSGNATDYRKILNRTKAAGLNRVELTFLSKEALEIALNVAEEVGMRTIVQDTKSFSGVADASPALIKSEIVARVEYLKRFSMLDGYFVWDEPFEKDFEKVKAINAILKEADPSRLAYSVIFPSYGVYNWTAGAYTWDDNSYTRYVNGYLDQVNPEIFSFDYYPYRTNVSSVNLIENDMWRDFGYIRKMAIAREKKLWCYIQAVNLITGQTSIINLERIRAQMYGALAYGVKGLSYYNSYGSLLDDVFEKTTMYDDLTILNNDVKNIGNVLFERKAEKL